jgi:hypothetical protein
MAMLADDVWKKVEAEIAGNWERSNAHGVDLRKCVVRPPVSNEYQESFVLSHKIDAQGRKVVDRWGERPRNLWLVLEEHPGTKSGYAIVYREETDVFGLALAGAVVGYYGTFLETLEAM